MKLGNARVGTHIDATAPGFLDVSGPFATKSGRIASLSAYVRGEVQAMSLRGVVYTDAGGHPRVRVATTKAVRIRAGAAGAWVRLSFAKTVRLKRGRYWLGFWYGPGAGSGGGGIAYTTAKGSEWYAKASYSASGRPPVRFPASRSSSHSRYSVFAPLHVVRERRKGNRSSSRGHGSSSGGHSSSRPRKGSPSTGSGSAHGGSSRTSGSGSGTVASATQAGSGASSGIYEDTREGFPKIAAYRPGCRTSGAQAARFDWMVTDGNCVGTLDAAYARNHSLLGMIEPTSPNGHLLYAATYGSYDRLTRTRSDASIGGIRGFRSSDWLHDQNGGVHAFGTVNVLDWLSNSTAIWSADVVAYWAKRDGALASRHPGVMGIWGDNDFWSDQGSSFTGTAVGSDRATWDTNFVAHHDRLAKDLPGLVIGGNDISSYSEDPALYKGSPADGWLLPGVSSAGMRECADRYYGLYTASGVDTLITSAQRFLAGEKLDGKQRYLMLNNCNASSDKVNEYSLAVATIGGYYYWPYTKSGGWGSTLSIAPAIPDVKRNGARHWLGSPTAAPRKLASGLWKRTFQHGVVYVNMTGSTRTVDGHAIGNETGLFVGS